MVDALRSYRPETATDLECDSTVRGGPLVAAEVPQPFRIEGHIASGGMGVVLRAVQRSLERPVALKVLRPELASSETQRCFLSEALINGGLVAAPENQHITRELAELLRNQALLERTRGQFASAVRAYDTLEARGLVASTDFFLQRGLARALNGNREEALQDLERAVAGARSVYPALWMLGLGGLPEHLPPPGSLWEAQLLDFFAGQRSAAELFSSVSCSPAAPAHKAGSESRYSPRAPRRRLVPRGHGFPGSEQLRRCAAALFSSAREGSPTERAGQLCEAHAYLGLLAEREGDTAPLSSTIEAASRPESPTTTSRCGRGIACACSSLDPPRPFSWNKLTPITVIVTVLVWKRTSTRTKSRN